MKSKDPDKYLQMHETQLILFDGAERMIQKMGLNPKKTNPIEIRKDYENIVTKKLFLSNKYVLTENKIKSLQKNLSNVEQFLEQNTNNSHKNQQYR